MATVDTIRIIADFFLLSVAWSLILFSPIANSKLTGVGLIKLLTNTAIGALVVSTIIHVFTRNQVSLATNVVALIAMFFITSKHEDEKSATMWTIYGSLVVILPTLIIRLQGPQLYPIPSLFLLSSALLLGIITYSMLLGHWYLVVPKLSAHPLKVAAIITWIILAVKILWAAHTLYNHYDFFEEQTQLGAGYAFNWMLLTMRVSFGYVVILGMSVFNWKLLQLRSIQSSTGILYAMTFFVFIGELVSMYMYLNYGLYI
jgi:hypothetical protein